MSETINLEKGQKVDITKTNPGLNKLILGGGWDVAATGSVDLDLAAYLMTGGKIEKTTDIVFFNYKKHDSGAIELDKDNLTGEGEGDDEKIFVDLSKVPAAIDKIVFSINIYKAAERSQNFGLVKNAFVRLVTPEGKELVKYDLSEDYSAFTAIIAGELYKKDGEWKFAALGEGVKGSIKEISAKYGL